MTKITRRNFGILTSSAIAGTIAGGSTVRAAAAVAPDIVLFCDPTLQPMMATLDRLWRAHGGAAVHVFCARSDIFIEQIWRGARCDLAVIEGEALADAAARRALIKAETRFSAWRNRLVLVAAGPRPPAVRLGPGADIAALLGVGGLALADHAIAPAGVATQAALETLGLAASLAGRTLGAENTEAVAMLVLDGKVPLGIVQQSDLAAAPGLSAVATFPDDAYPPIAYVMAQAADVRTAAAPRFQEFLRSPEAKASIAAAGLEVTS